MDTVLDQAGVLLCQWRSTQLALEHKSTVLSVVTVDTFVSNLPSDLADGDADTQLDQAVVGIHKWSNHQSWNSITSQQSTLLDSPLFVQMVKFLLQLLQ